MTTLGADTFASAPAISVGQTSAVTSNSTYTRETGEPTGTGYRTAWWTFTPATSGTVTLDTHDTQGGDPDTILSVYTGSAVGALTLVASNDDEAYPQVITSQVVFTATAGTTYRVVVGAYSSSTVMSYVLKVAAGSPTPPPPGSGTVEILNAGTVHADGSAVKVGGGAVWSDGSDATYVELVASTGSSWAVLYELAADPAKVTAIAYRVRTWASEPIEGFQFQFEWSGVFMGRTSGDDLPAGFHDLHYTFTATDYTDNGRTMLDVATRLGGYTEFEALFASQTGTVRVLEARVEVTYSSGVRYIRKCRRFPRDD